MDTIGLAVMDTTANGRYIFIFNLLMINLRMTDL